MTDPQIIEAELTWTGEQFEPGIRVAVGPSGRIARVGGVELEPTLSLPGRALIPGMVNGHSHAFQRGLRGRGERYPESTGSFWSWREEMYQLVTRLDRAAFKDLTLQAFREMRAAGITSVGEFHYVHHSTADGPVDFELDTVILEAAHEAEIRLVLLNAFYQHGGIGRALEGAQRRFRTDDLEAFWSQMESLAERLDRETQSLGVVAHSVRAVGLDEIAWLYDAALHHNLPFHMHVEEQRREIEECREVFGTTPMELLLDRLPISTNFTGVHCTHTQPAILRRLLAAGGHVCITPLTEANLGDGIADVEGLREIPGQIALGSDSNSRISLIEEMRWLEYVQRLQGETRGVFRDSVGSVARPLFESATRGGARALRIDTGAIAEGLWADFATIELEHPMLAGVPPENLLEAFVFGTTEEVISSTCVGGKWIDKERG